MSLYASSGGEFCTSRGRSRDNSRGRQTLRKTQLLSRIMVKYCVYERYDECTMPAKATSLIHIQRRRAAIYQIMKYVSRACIYALHKYNKYIQQLLTSVQALRRMSRRCFSSKYLANNFDTRSLVVVHFKGKENDRPARCRASLMDKG